MAAAGGKDAVRARGVLHGFGAGALAKRSLPADAHVGVVLCGSNIALADIDALLEQFGL